jgi:dTDP-4-dehydrorhamnose reductase
MRSLDNSLPFSRVLIAGGRGLVGTPTTKAISLLPGVHTTSLAHGELDIVDTEAVRSCMAAVKPDLVINCAAYTKVDDCEANVDLAMRVNAEGAGTLAKAAANAGARFVHLSTDYVFPGDSSRPYREDDPVAPMERLSGYGRSKLAGEHAVQAAHPRPLIVRTAWVYGPDGPGFPNAILKAAREKPRLKVVNDQTGSPTYAPDLAQALLALARVQLTGFVHVTNAGICTWYEFACEIVRGAGLSTPVDPCTTAEFPRPARRPAYSVLNNNRYIAATGEPLRHWKDALQAFIQGALSPPKPAEP